MDLLLKLFKALNSDSSPGQISLGLMLGMLLGLIPLVNLGGVLLLLIVCLLRCNLAAVIAAFTAFAGLTWLLDPWMMRLGEHLLGLDLLAPLWTQLYQSDLWRLTHFNNTLTLGAWASGLTLFVPGLLLSNVLIRRYREHVLGWVEGLHIVQILKSSKLFALYQNLPPR